MKVTIIVLNMLLYIPQYTCFNNNYCECIWYMLLYNYVALGLVYILVLFLLILRYHHSLPYLVVSFESIQQFSLVLILQQSIHDKIKK